MQETLTDVFYSLSGEDKLLLALLKSAIDDKDLDFINGDTFESICNYFNIDPVQYRKLARKAIKSGHKLKFKLMK